MRYAANQPISSSKVTVLRARFLPLLCAFLALFSAAENGFSQTTTTAFAPRSFRIGYLHGDPETQLGPSVFYAIRDFLLSRPAIQQAMQQEQISGIDIWASDSHQDLTQRMDQNEFDLVFCSSVDFVLQSGSYDPVLQLRHPEGRFDAAGRAFFHWGVIFVNNRSKLFDAPTTGTELGDYFRTHQVAMVNSFSAAGYVYPTLRIADLTSHTLTPAPLFCNSSEEVVKYVINGITEAGACEAGVIDKVLEANGLKSQRDKLVRVILETDPIPTDPVALNDRWAPQRSILGREIRDSLRQYFSRPENGLPRLESSSRDRYEDLRRNMTVVRQLQ